MTEEHYEDLPKSWDLEAKEVLARRERRTDGCFWPAGQVEQSCGGPKEPPVMGMEGHLTGAETTPVGRVEYDIT